MLLEEQRARHQRSLGDCPDLLARIETRRFLVAAEAEDLIAWRQALLDDAVAQGMETSEQGFTRSRFRAIRNARDMAVHMRDVWLARLAALAEAVQNPAFGEYKLLMLTLD
jgi:ATP-dependent helicase HepA